MEEDRNIFRRVLREQTELAYELQFVRWLAARRFDEELADAVSSLLKDNLSKRGFLAGTTSGYLRIHDLVYSAIQIEIVVRENVEDRLRQRIATLIRRECETDRILLQRLARMHAEFFARLVSQRRQPEFVYMAAMNRTGPAIIPLLGNPVAAAADLLQTAPLHERTLEIRAVIEVVEALFTLRDTHVSKEEARTKLGGDLKAFEMVLGHDGLTVDQKTMLQYHRAKMLPRLDAEGRTAGRDQAIAIFRELLGREPSSAGVRNQLAKLLPAEASIEQCELVLERYVDAPDSVNWNVVLDSFRLLVRHGGDMARHEGLLMATIEYAKSIDPSEAFRFVVSVGQRAWFNAPQLLVPMFDALGASTQESAPSDAFSLAQAHKFASRESDAPRQGELLAQALRLYEQAQPTSEYQRTHYAEAFIGWPPPASLRRTVRVRSALVVLVAAAGRGTVWPWRSRGRIDSD